jgi:hypothetical protein
MLSSGARVAQHLAAVAYTGAGFLRHGRNSWYLDDLENYMQWLRREHGDVYAKMQEKEVPRRDRG